MSDRIDFEIVCPKDRWNLTNLDERTAHIELKPRLVSSDLRVRLQAAMHGIGIALLPEQVISAPLKERLVERVLPEWSGAKNILHLVYPTPRGMRPSVRSLIDYLLIHVPAWLRERGIWSREAFNSPPSARQRACPLS
jgi:DNA-binding transcriptional LysR family regulator